MTKLVKPLLVVFILVLCISLPAAAQPWLAVMEGNGTVNQPGTLGAELGWSLKLALEDGKYYVYGTLNIVEKLEDGNRHFQLNLQKLPLDAGNLTVRPVLFNVPVDEVRVEATGMWKLPGKANRIPVTIAAHFRGSRNTVAPCTVWYYVQYLGSSVYVTNSNARLPVTGDPFSIVTPDAP